MTTYNVLRPYQENLALHLELVEPSAFRKLITNAIGFFYKRVRKQVVREKVFSERLVEYPLLYNYLSLKPGQEILDFGCVESLLPMQLCSFGIKVTGMDFRPYPFQHENFSFIQGDILQWDPPENRFDSVISISVIEHVGLSGYGDPELNDGDRIAVRKLLASLKPGGRLYFTVPVGKARTVGRYYRVYDRRTLGELVPEMELVRVFGKDHRYSGWREMSLDRISSLEYDNYEEMAPVQGVAFVVAVKRGE